MFKILGPENFGSLRKFVDRPPPVIDHAFGFMSCPPIGRQDIVSNFNQKVALVCLNDFSIGKLKVELSSRYLRSGIGDGDTGFFL